MNFVFFYICVLFLSLSAFLCAYRPTMYGILGEVTRVTMQRARLLESNADGDISQGKPNGNGNGNGDENSNCNSIAKS